MFESSCQVVKQTKKAKMMMKSNVPILDNVIIKIAHNVLTTELPIPHFCVFTY